MARTIKSISVPEGKLNEINEASISLIGVKKQSSYFLRLHDLYLNKLPDNRKSNLVILKRILVDLNQILVLMDYCVLQGAQPDPSIYERIEAIEKLFKEQTK